MWGYVLFLSVRWYFICSLICFFFMVLLNCCCFFVYVVIGTMISLKCCVLGFIGWRRVILVVVLGVLVVFVFLLFHVLFVFVFVFVGFVWLVESVGGWCGALVIGWWFGFGYFVVGFYWVAFLFFVYVE